MLSGGWSDFAEILHGDKYEGPEKLERVKLKLKVEFSHQGAFF